MKRLLATISRLVAFIALAGTAYAVSLEEGFRSPPEQTKPWVYWYWISDNISRDGITRDLEAMARAGIGEALIGNIFLDEIKPGGAKVLSGEWWGLVEHAIREGGRVGVNIGMFNCPGWSQSGGPWIKPEQSMRYLVSSETRVKGPARFQEKLPVPAHPFQDVAVLAFSVPQADADSIDARGVRVTCTPAAEDANRLVDGRLDTECAFPPGAGQGAKAFTVELELAAPFTARSLSVYPARRPFAARCELQAMGNDGTYRAVRAFRFDRSNMAIGVGPMPQGPVTVAFAATTASRFRLVWTDAQGDGAVAEVRLSGAAKLESFVEKQLGKMHPTPLPMWDTYLWSTQGEPDSKQLVVSSSDVREITRQLGPDGTLRWDVPEGEWIILRTGMTPTGMRNAPASPEGQGLEVDKMNRQAAEMHFNAFIGEVLSRIPAAERKAFTRVVADSYEMGSQNWTDGLAEVFRTRYGYDPLPWLPVLTGRIVESADRSERFLWDLRRLVADRVAKDYVGGLRDLCRPHGLQLWLENYGHWGFPAEFLQYGGQSDRIGGEFWVTGDLGSIECRAASSAANTYGKPVVSAEAFTGGPAFQTAPWGLKARGDWAFCEGINHFVLHVCIQQPWEDRVPGVNAWFGTEFNRHNTWFEPGRAWIDYLRRCSFLLQQGTRLADVAYFIGEDVPKMTGIRKPDLPPGFDFDYINAEVILEKLSVRDGQLVLPHGTSYRVLVLPELPTMRPAVLRRIVDLVKQGATIVGQPPSRSPSMESFPACDEEVKRLSAELWGDAQIGKPGERRVGRGRIVWGKGLAEVLGEAGVGPDFASDTRVRFTHRAAGDIHIYFVANPKPEPLATMASFRVSGRIPEFWWPDTGRMERPAVYDHAGGSTRLPINLGAHESVFVVFRENAAAEERIVSVVRNGEVLIDTARQAAREPASSSADATSSFTMAVWVRPADSTTLLPEANEGVHGLGDPRNDVLFPPHGNTFSGEGSHAGCGLAVGRNGVCVFEHGANYFSPVLVHATNLVDWTHVAVVYRDGEPSLYLNGVLVHKGLRSRFIVHGGSGSQGGGGVGFRGQLGSVEQFAAALTDAEVAKLTRSMPRPGSQLPASSIQLTRTPGGGIDAQVWQAGVYELKTASGKVKKLEVASVPEPLRIAGPWEVQFASGWGAPEKVTFEQLQDWIQRPEEGIRHYSGKATYRKTLNLPEISKGRRFYLDLGSVRDIATVRVNGKDLGTVWMAPWCMEITSAVRPGSNAVEIDVVNAWNNRLVGDAALPAEQRRTFLAAPTVQKDAPLLPAGLLGPVLVRMTERIECE